MKILGLGRRCVPFLLVLVAAPLLAMAAQQSQTQESPTQILSENGPSVALIVSADETSVSLGSGFFVGDGSLLVTDFHVVEGSKKILVKLGDGKILAADTVASFDADRDLVLLQVGVGNGSSNHRGLALGDSDAIKVGEPVVVISNPEGLEHSVSNGLISGVRSLDKWPKLLQISAPISPGSSGGPVFNDRGQVIGVVVSYLEGGQNLNFAIPINLVKEMMLRTSNTPLADLPPRKAPGEAEENASGQLNLDGSWTATFADSVSTGQMAFNLSQEPSGAVTGTYTTSLGGGGTVTGHVADDVFQFQLDQTIETCPGRFTGSAHLKEGTVSGSYAGNSCDGVHANGSFSMVRGEAPIATPTAINPSAQKPIIEYGTESELRDVRTVYVYSEDLEIRGNIIKELRKDKEVVVTNDPVAADVILVFGGSTFSLGNYTYVWSDANGNVHGTSTPRYAVTGVGFAVKIKPPNTVKVLWQFQATRTLVFQRRPSTNFVRNFVSIIKKLRNAPSTPNLR